MTRLTVRHVTTYSYRRPVGFGEHRLMFRPRDSHDLRLLETALAISPKAQVHWLHDVFSNSIAIAAFEEKAERLSFDSRFVMEHYGLSNPSFPIEPFARTFPFSYASTEVPDLTRTMERHYPDPEHRLDAWAKSFVEGNGPLDTQDLLERITRAIFERFSYQRRIAVGTQTPIETLEQGSGSCRDLALFMMEAVRALGFAARFVTGYLYDPSREPGAAGGAPSVRGSGDTHAWVQVYLPGAGWVEFDPTNGLVGGANLIRVAVARDPSQAVPLQGSYLGAPDDFLEMKVEVEVREESEGEGEERGSQPLKGS